VDALTAATRLKLPFENIHWNFNDQAFKQIDWTTEPDTDIKLLYQARARQLREKYDYIIINCSGGSDSNTALFSFLDQGLHVDEIVVRYAKTGTEKYGFDLWNAKAENEFSEFKFAVLPMLATVKKVSPNTKITVHDHSLDALNLDKNFDENFIYWCGDCQSPGFITRFQHNTLIEDLRVFDKDKKIAIIFGIDKPKIHLKNGHMYCYFVDRVAQPGLIPTFYSDNTNITSELFYWTPDLPDMLVKQAHLMKRWYETKSNHSLVRLLDPLKQAVPQHRGTYETIAKGILYPDYDLATFQAQKPCRFTLQEWDFWIKDHTQSNGYKVWLSGIKHIAQNVNASYLQGVVDFEKFDWAMRMIISNEYCLGPTHVQIPTSQVNITY
jgi:hypothetical protein